MQKKNIEVLRKILYAVESGGQVYGCQNYAAFIGAGANCSNEKAITIGAGQWYAGEAKRLLQKIQRANPAQFKKLDTQGIETDLLKKDWSTYAIAVTSAKAKCIVTIINSVLGRKCQDELMDEQIAEYATSIAKTYGTMPDIAMMECVNIYHQGGASALKRILAKTAKPYTADKIYATLREDLNDPVQNQVGDYESRQKAVIEMIHKYADEGAQKGETIMGVRMSNCGHDENGRYAGGKAGDQTGTDWYLRSWYAYSNGGWNYILRWKNEVLGNLFADLAIEAAQNDMIGYDQGTAGNSGDRYTFRQQMKAVGYRPSKITKPCECDCSEGTIVLIQAVGYLKGIKELQECNATYTGNMMNYFNSAKGKKYFTVLQGQYLKDSNLARRGDINLNTGHHVNVTVDNGSNSAKGSSANTSATKSIVTLTDKIEVQLPVLQKGSKGVAVSMLQAMLNVKVDGDFGNDTETSLKAFQKNVKLTADGICGADTWTKVIEHMKANTK